MVERKTTASYWARFALVNCVESSVASTLKSFWAPSCSMAAMPAGIESCRKPAVLEKTRTFSSWSVGSLPSPWTVTEPVIVVGCTSQRYV